MSDDRIAPPPMIAHMVYFTLNDASPKATLKLIDDCYRYLKNIPGIAFFSAGKLVEDLCRPVNDRDFHVGLHVVFKTREAHDAYQAHAQHLEFIEANKANWKQVRVFDSVTRG